MTDAPAPTATPRGFGLPRPATIVGLALLGGVCLSALLADVIAPYDPDLQSYTTVLQAPSLAHPLGTDNFGRDLLSRMFHGGRVAIMVGFGAVGLAVMVGVLLGLVAGYVRGLADEAIMRVMDAILAFPSLMLALGITVAFGPSLATIIIAIAISDIPVFARLTRGQVLSIRERDFVTAAVVMGARPPRVILRHILPHVAGPIVALATLHVGLAILTEAALSFLGLGVQPPTASWGAILRTGFGFIELAPWIAIFSGLFIFMTVFGACLLGDAQRERADPRQAVRAR
jgi:ABC-type dipeptide/oligopeptide/nickel transport system permease subunit